MAHGFSNIGYVCVEIFPVSITVNHVSLMIQVSVRAFVGVSVMGERRLIERQLSAEKGSIVKRSHTPSHLRQFANL